MSCSRSRTPSSNRSSSRWGARAEGGKAGGAQPHSCVQHGRQARPCAAHAVHAVDVGRGKGGAGAAAGMHVPRVCSALCCPLAPPSTLVSIPEAFRLAARAPRRPPPPPCTPCRPAPCCKRRAASGAVPCRAGSQTSEPVLIGRGEHAILDPGAPGGADVNGAPFISALSEPTAD